MTPQDFIAAIKDAAVASAKQTGIPASFTIAEAALESGWGTSKLCQVAHNLFGVKADSSWHGIVQPYRTQEVIGGKTVVVEAKWRSYPDWLAAINDHAAFLTGNERYKGCFAHKDGPSFADAVAAAGYATDPDYAAKIKAVIHAHDLTTIDV